MKTSQQTVAGQTLLWTFLTQHGLKQVDAARALRVSAPTIHSWLFGAKAPRTLHREAIQRWTSGAVPVASWEAPDALQRLEQEIQPFTPTSEPLAPVRCHECGAFPRFRSPRVSNPPESGAPQTGGEPHERP